MQLVVQFWKQMIFCMIKLHKDIPDISNQKAKELFVMGDRYYLGKMCKVDQRMAVKYYEDSAVLGYEPAQCKLAKCYEFGYGCEKDKQKSLFWYEKAAENGNMEAQYKVGISYDFGRGCAIDKQRLLCGIEKLQFKDIKRREKCW